jgi:hypothetical protein
MNKLEEKAAELIALGQSYGLTPQLEKVEDDDRLRVKHANQFWTVVSLTPRGRVSVYSCEKVNGRYWDIATKNLPVYLEKYARREKKEGAK